LFGLTRKFIKKKRRPAVGATLPLKVAKMYFAGTKWNKLFP